MIVTDSVIWNNNNNTWNRKECMQLSRLIIKFIDWMKLCIDFQWLIFFRRSCAMSESSSNFLLLTTKDVLLLAAVTLSFVPYPSCSARPRMLFAWAASFEIPFWDNTKGRMVPFGVGIVSMRESLRQSAAGSVSSWSWDLSRMMIFCVEMLFMIFSAASTAVAEISVDQVGCSAGLVRCLF